MNKPSPNDDLHAPFDCWDDEGAWDDLRDEVKAREYVKVVAAVKERLGITASTKRGTSNDVDQ